MTVQNLGGMTWREVKAFVHERVVALLPLGSLEAHGPHLPLNTDVVLAVEVARRAARQLSQKGIDLLVWPPVVFSPAPLASKFAGTVDLPAEAYAATLRGLLGEMAALGIRTACLVTCHLDPRHLEVVRGIAREYPGNGGLKILFPDVTQEPWRSRMPEEFRQGGFHGGRCETAAMMALQEDKVREEIRRRLVRVEASLDEGIRQGKTHYAECGGLQAYFGDPAAASPAEGEPVLDALAGIVSDLVVLGRA